MIHFLESHTILQANEKYSIKTKSTFYKNLRGCAKASHRDFGMKILLCNLAIRQHRSNWPPVACTSLCNVLIREGYNPVFYDIDAKRPSLEDLYRYYEKERYNIVGISAVVSTGYEYTKRLARIIKKASPETQIILGGNLAAAYEVILRKCQIDICVIGEGEKVLINLVKHYEKYRSLKPINSELHRIKGIAFLEKGGICKFTEPERVISSKEIEQPDYELLDKFSNINQYIRDPMARDDFSDDPRSYERHRWGKKMATVFTAKGCVNRCTFCHRWIKGYRVSSVEKVITAMKNLIDKYNIGFFCFSDECFGENKEWLDNFIEAVRPLDILFQIGGARVSIIKQDPSVIRRLKEVGLTRINFGMESGSDRILKIMEKNATVNDNLTVAKLCNEAGISTVIQLVIGMPGENDKTIHETIEFVKQATGDLPHLPKVGANYLQALPGTPSYEYLRNQGLIGKSIEDEEEYLLRESDVNALEFKQYVNVSEEPLSKVELWPNKIAISSRIHWLKRHGWRFPDSFAIEYNKEKVAAASFVAKSKLFFKHRTITYRIIDLFGDLFWKIVQLGNLYSLYGFKKTILILFGFIEEDNRTRFRIESVSLRKIVLLEQASLKS